MKRFLTVIVVASASVWLAACRGTEGERINPDVEAVKSQDYNPEDLRLNVENGVRDLTQKATRILGADAFAGRPIVFVAPVVNRTDEHIDPKMIQGYLETELTDKLSVRLVDRSAAKDVAEKEVLFQQGSLVDSQSAQKIGRSLGAKYFLFAEVTNRRTFTRSRETEGQFFYFQLALVTVETLEKVPVDVRIQKVAQRGWFGW